MKPGCFAARSASDIIYDTCFSRPSKTITFYINLVCIAVVTSLGFAPSHLLLLLCTCLRSWLLPSHPGWQPVTWAQCAFSCLFWGWHVNGLNAFKRETRMLKFSIYVFFYIHQGVLKKNSWPGQEEILTIKSEIWSGFCLCLCTCGFGNLVEWITFHASSIL